MQSAGPGSEFEVGSFPILNGLAAVPHTSSAVYAFLTIEADAAFRIDVRKPTFWSAHELLHFPLFGGRSRQALGRTEATEVGHDQLRVHVPLCQVLRLAERR